MDHPQGAKVAVPSAHQMAGMHTEQHALLDITTATSTEWISTNMRSILQQTLSGWWQQKMAWGVLNNSSKTKILLLSHSNSSFLTVTLLAALAVSDVGQLSGWTLVLLLRLPGTRLVLGNSNKPPVWPKFQQLCSNLSTAKENWWNWVDSKRVVYHSQSLTCVNYG